MVRPGGSACMEIDCERLANTIAMMVVCDIETTHPDVILYSDVFDGRSLVRPVLR